MNGINGMMMNLETVSFNSRVYMALKILSIVYTCVHCIDVGFLYYYHMYTDTAKKKCLLSIQSKHTIHEYIQV